MFVILICSPDVRQSFLLSSKTEFKFSTQSYNYYNYLDLQDHQKQSIFLHHLITPQQNLSYILEEYHQTSFLFLHQKIHIIKIFIHSLVSFFDKLLY